MAKLFKDLYNEKYIDLLSCKICVNYPQFNTKDFIKAIFTSKWKALELKQRMRHISTTLGLYLPKKYEEAIDILENTFVIMNNNYMLENMIFQDFVEVYGLNEFEISLSALEIFTIQSSSEFAIRQFILKNEQKTMIQMQLWAKSKNEHIRRLASEGCRSRLPWAIALPLFKKNPTEIVKILELLKDDESAYVRKSVANNINDISKDNTQIVVDLTKRWLGFSKNRDTILKHGCRTLLKSSNMEVLKLFGFNKPVHLKVEHFTYTKNVKMGEELLFEFDIKSNLTLGKVRIEFALGFLRKNGQQNKKVFQISESELKSSTKHIKKTYSFRPISTRLYYQGEQTLSIIINGVVFKEVKFTLL